VRCLFHPQEHGKILVCDIFSETSTARDGRSALGPNVFKCRNPSPGPEATPAAPAHVDQQYLNNSVNPALVLYLAERRKMDAQAESDPLRHRFEMTPSSPRALPAADFSYMHGINLMASTPVLPGGLMCRLVD
jgi:hypothetical protein